ncbi:serum response factor-like [Asterias rubens]|uniref:serum response factor-like n=1 Tax=Asterias rubens TaxID=7604 RepID=UPI001455C22C|nr:serum response factor-like [Asterias rubens]
MKRGAQSSIGGTMNVASFLNQQAVSNNGSGVHHLVNGEKRPAGEMEECTFTQFNPQHLEIDEEHGDLSDDDDDDPHGGPGAKKSKKTKGRVKIKMEFIENKLRRYTTFSKRKTGIMKKAYELSTLTGTQVMLLVASETGHVYTFATRKLQPMITSESGKALIQTCLNSPDPATAAHHHNPDQRMSATGFEETELTYQVTEEELAKEGKTQMFTVTNVPGAGVDVSSPGLASSQSGISITGAGHTYPMTTYLPTGSSSGGSTVGGSNGNKALGGMTASDMLAQGGFTTAVLPQGTTLPAGASIPAGVLQLPHSHSQGQQSPSSTANQTMHPPQLLYRLQQPGGPMSPLVLSPTVTSVTSATAPSQSITSSSAQESIVNMSVPPSLVSTVSSTSSAAAASPLMYHTQSGIVYATSPGSIPENLLLPSYQASMSGSHAHDRGNVNIGLIPVSTGQATTHAIVPMTISKAGLDSKQNLSQGGERKHLSSPGELKALNSRQFLLPPPTKHR